ncbi:MAG: ABC transporter ATP-binding protein [bacterium]
MAESNIARFTEKCRRGITMNIKIPQGKISFEPHEDVDIIIGVNGSGKSFLLKALAEKFQDKERAVMYLKEDRIAPSNLEVSGDDFKPAIEAAKKHFQNFNVSNVESYSWGERHLLMILKEALKKPDIVIIDTPEIGLHLEWQEDLIRVIREIGEKPQIFIATHSPSIPFKNWAANMIDMAALI